MVELNEVEKSKNTQKSDLLKVIKLMNDAEKALERGLEHIFVHDREYCKPGSKIEELIMDPRDKLGQATILENESKGEHTLRLSAYSPHGTFFVPFSSKEKPRLGNETFAKDEYPGFRFARYEDVLKPEIELQEEGYKNEIKYLQEKITKLKERLKRPPVPSDSQRDEINEKIASYEKQLNRCPVGFEIKPVHLKNDFTKTELTLYVSIPKMKSKKELEV